ncbi:hypothetical protein B0T18DRAFT_395995 [Schizothecium vesticola]|uniref:Uncharacterized protein n=1 Tax=Schizothecium vesticola TaxID=314040 RepID=A0AA40KBI3_9PEZI|nr:hypothetical protein B0T18DRAFT_395995 [Schizothecium vesticola]
MVEGGGGAWKDCLFFPSAREACLSVAGVQDPKYGTGILYVPMSNVQSRLLNCKHGSQFFSVLFQLSLRHHHHHQPTIFASSPPHSTSPTL